MNLSNFCGICLEATTNIDDCVLFKSKMKAENSTDEFTYLDCFELVTHLKMDLNTMQNLYLCSNCCQELENSFNFLRKAENSQRILYEKIELNQAHKQTEINQNLDLNDLIEEIVSDDYSTVPVLTDAMLGTNSLDCFDVITENETILYCENDIENDHLSPIGPNEDNLTLSDVIISADDGVHFSAYDDDDESTHNKAFKKKYKCTLCSKKFNTSASFKTHQKYHKRKTNTHNSNTCGICVKKFSTGSYLRQHMELVHADERQQFKCDQCEKIYFTTNALRNHKRFHTGETINCADCDKSFATRYDFKIHMRFHTREYPFVCNVCDKKFAIKGHLKTHMWEHQGLKLQCENCGKLFSSTKALTDHSFVHTGEMPYPCNHCKKSYPSKQKYKVHLMAAHKIEFDDSEHAAANIKSLVKPMSRRKNLTLVQVDSVMKEIEIEDRSESETCNETESSFDEVVLEVS